MKKQYFYPAQNGMLKTMLPVGSGLLIRCMFKAGRQYPAACMQTRIDIDEMLNRSILDW